MNWDLLLKQFSLPGNDRDLVDVLLREDIDGFITEAKEALTGDTVPRNKRLFFDKYLKRFSAEQTEQLLSILSPELESRFGDWTPNSIEERISNNYRKIHEDLGEYIERPVRGAARQATDERESFISELHQIIDEIQAGQDVNWTNLEEMANDIWSGPRIQPSNIGPIFDRFSNNEQETIVDGFGKYIVYDTNEDGKRILLPNDYPKLTAIFMRMLDFDYSETGDWTYSVPEINKEKAIEYIELFQERRSLPNNTGANRTNRDFKIKELNELSAKTQRLDRLHETIKSLIRYDISQQGTELTSLLVRDLQRKFIRPGSVRERIIDMAFSVYRDESKKNAVERKLGLSLDPVLDYEKVVDGLEYAKFSTVLNDFFEDAEGIRFETEAENKFREMVSSIDLGMPPIFRDFFDTIIRGEYEEELVRILGKRTYNTFLQEARNNYDMGQAYLRAGNITDKEGNQFEIWKFPESNNTYSNVANGLLENLERKPIKEMDGKYAPLRIEYTQFKNNERYAHRLTNNIIGDLLGVQNNPLTNKFQDSFRKALTNLFLDVRSGVLDLDDLNDDDLSGGKDIKYLIKLIRLAEIKILNKYNIHETFNSYGDKLKKASDEELLEFVNKFYQIFESIQKQIQTKIIQLVDEKINDIKDNLRMYSRANNRIRQYLIDAQLLIPVAGGQE